MMKQTKRYINRLFGLLLFTVVLVFVSYGTIAQSLLQPPPLFSDQAKIKPADTLKSGLSFVVDSLLTIKDETDHLRPVYERLKALEAGKDTVLTIVHLGDSHVQAGHLSGRIMRLLHQQFGNAGRGWISPLKLSRTNEPNDYFLRSAAKEWVAGRIIQREKKTSIGPGGIGIKTISPSVNLDIVIAPNNGAGYDFNQAVLYRGEKSTPMLPAGANKNSVTTFRNTEPLAPNLLMDTFKITKEVDLLQLHSTRRKPGTDELLPASAFSNLYYGFNLTNGQPGILYHSIGVNGAMYVNYTDSDFMQRLALLKPDLLIVSLGTNESFGSRFSESEFRNQIHDFLEMVKRYIPNTTLILTTPAECYKRIRVNKQRTYVVNDNIAKAVSAITKQAKQEGIAYWNLFAATGGKKSSQEWYKNGYLGKDRVHFTKTGYQEQADLFFLSWMSKWKDYKKNEVEKEAE